jgi:hypothetical protein
MEEIFLFSKISKPVVEPNEPLVQWGLLFVPRVKAVRAWN